MSPEQTGATPRRPSRNIRNHAPAIVAVCIATLLATAVPALGRAAYDAVNAHKVDGKHAVSATTNANARKGKLVAADSKGFLPENITRKTSGYAEQSPRTKQVLRTAGAATLASVNITVKDECGGRKTRHRYIVTGAGWAANFRSSVGIPRMQVSSGTTIEDGPGLSIITLSSGTLGYAYSQMTSQRRITVSPGARKFSLLVDSVNSVSDSVEFGDATLTVIDGGYICATTASTS